MFADTILSLENGREKEEYPELIFKERVYYDKKRKNWILNKFTDLSPLAKIHGYLLGLKSIKTLEVGHQKI
jgi:hypothetical protein